MPLISIIEDFHPKNDAKLLGRAEELKPVLHHTIVEPKGGFVLKERYSAEEDEIVLQDLDQLPLGKGQNLCLDFGDHYVGRVTLNLAFKGSHPDAPAFLKLKFCETRKELSENSSDYDGWISDSWIQEEYVHVDELPCTLSLPRRYAFRYMKITILDTSPKYKLIIRSAELVHETSAGELKKPLKKTGDAMLDRIQEVSLRTLANCMQEVFEDGPKRDRRLWMGDLRLQALVNYESFKNYDLVKRCLYLFAGTRFPEGKVSACVFTGNGAEADDTWLFDYSLFFVCALEEYLQETDDMEALEDLYECAMEQMDIARSLCDETGLLKKEAVENTFIDWREGLDKAACAQAVLAYTIPYAVSLALWKKDQETADRLSGFLARVKEAARAVYWNEEEQCFISNGQKSLASQVWMVLAEVVSGEEAVSLMKRSEEFNGSVRMLTPYMHHYYVSALLKCGLKKEAFDHIREYWGGMVKMGADTFWESYDDENPEVSPYGGKVIDSFCHAWSCTPLYLISQYMEENDNEKAGF